MGMLTQIFWWQFGIFAIKTSDSQKLSDAVQSDSIINNIVDYTMCFTMVYVIWWHYVHTLPRTILTSESPPLMIRIAIFNQIKLEKENIAAQPLKLLLTLECFVLLKCFTSLWRRDWCCWGSHQLCLHWSSLLCQWACGSYNSRALSCCRPWCGCKRHGACVDVSWYVRM